jgi:hypothetical protein
MGIAKKLSSMRERILVRRSRVVELYSEGLNVVQIGKKLNVPRSTVGSDVRVLRAQARTSLKTFVEEQLPFEHRTVLVGVTKPLTKAWSILEDEKSTEKAIAMAMHTILSCYTLSCYAIKWTYHLLFMTKSKIMKNMNQDHSKDLLRPLFQDVGIQRPFFE